jgi:hypothetical protein
VRARSFSDEALAALVARGLSKAAMARELGVSVTAVRHRLSRLHPLAHSERAAEARRDVAAVVVAPARRVTIADIAGKLHDSIARLEGIVAFLDADQQREDAKDAADPPRLSTRDRLMLRATVEARIHSWSERLLAVQEHVLRFRDIERFIDAVLTALDEHPGLRPSFEARLNQLGPAHMAAPTASLPSAPAAP